MRVKITETRVVETELGPDNYPAEWTWEDVLDHEQNALEEDPFLLDDLLSKYGADIKVVIEELE